MGLGKEWYDSINKIYKERKENAFEILDLLKCTYDDAQGGMFVWAKVPSAFKDSFALSDEVLYNANVFITPGGIFGSNGNNYVRISLCAPINKFEEAIARIKSSRQ